VAAYRDPVRRKQLQMKSDERQIVKLFEDGDHALIATYLAELSCIFADDYIQYDESGHAFAKRDVLNLHRPPNTRTE
jgi:hypothetical protein